MLGMKMLQPDSEIKIWERIAERSKLTAEFIFRLDGRRLVSKKDLRRIWDCTEDTIKSYSRKGMPQVNISDLVAEGVARAQRIDPKYVWVLPNFAAYDLAEVNAWRDANISKKLGSGAARARKLIEEPLPPEDSITDAAEPTPEVAKGNYALREVIAKTLQAEEAATLARLKRQALEGSLVEADDLDKAMAEQAILHKTDKINDEKVLPTLLAGKDANEIAILLHEHNQERLTHFDRIINKEFKAPETLYNVVEAVLAKLSQGVSPDQIIKAINA
jgi:hypothetical protein